MLFKSKKQIERSIVFYRNYIDVQRKCTKRQPTVILAILRHFFKIIKVTKSVASDVLMLRK